MVLLITILYWVYISLLIIALIYGIANRNFLSDGVRYIITIIGVSLICELAGEVLFWTIGTNFPTFHLLNIGLIILYPFAYRAFWRPFKYKKVLVTLGFILAALFLFQPLFREKGFFEFPSFSSAVLSLSVVFCV